jgi:two-component system, NtrC family, nitrogen regulation sensor histidine kinase NtrY
MVFKRYQFQILFRLLLIVANCLGVIYVRQLQQYWISFFNLVALLILQVFLLFRYLTRWQQDVRVFANSVRHGDFNISYHLVDKNDAHYELYQMLNSITSYVRSLQSQFVQQNQYFEYVVKNAQVGLMAYDDKGRVLLSNDEALLLLGNKSLKIFGQLAGSDSVLHDQLVSLSLNQPKLIRGGADKTVRLSARLSKIVIEGKSIFLLSLININPELAENELQSWQDLISVLTHEIMNSVTPIHSLTGSMNKYMDRIEGNDEVVAKAKHSLDVITRRSQSLMTFVDRYRTISTVPLPRLEMIDLSKLISDVLLLMENELSRVKVRFAHRSTDVKVDPSLVEQVIINVLKNALSAVAEKTEPQIQIELTSDDKFVTVSVSDNGKGIPSNVIGKIFIPFFTTRENGSGIGLTLSRQIMHRHGGTIEIRSEEGKGTTCVLKFPYV